MHKKYPNSKFVLVEYPEISICRNESWASGFYLTEEQIAEIEKMGIIYVNLKELVGDKLCDKRYRAQDGAHPGALAWDLIVPKLAKKLDL